MPLSPLPVALVDVVHLAPGLPWEPPVPSGPEYDGVYLETHTGFALTTQQNEQLLVQ